MASNIDPSKPTSTRAFTADVRANFSAAKSEIEALQAAHGPVVNVVDAKGDLIAGTAADTVARLAAGTNEQRLVADSTQTTGLKYVADTTNYAIGAKGDLLVGTAADTVARKVVGTDGYPLAPLSGATDGLAYLPPGLGYNLVGGYLDWTVSGNVLTVAVKTWAGNDPSATEPVFYPVRDVTASTGSLTYRKLTAATSIAINDTALLGTVNSVAFRLWAVIFNDGGTDRLAVINCVTTSANAGSGRNVDAIYPLAGWGIASATQEADGADSAQVFYSNGAAVTDKAYTTLGYATWESGLATAGTWSAGPTRTQLFGPGVPLPGHRVQLATSYSGDAGTTTTAIPVDDTIPQNTEGAEFMAKAITPTSAANALRVSHGGMYGVNADTDIATIAVFRDTTANALFAQFTSQASGANGFAGPINIERCILADTTAATTFKVRAGPGSGSNTVTFNGNASARRYGGVASSYLMAEEIMG